MNNRLVILILFIAIVIITILPIPLQGQGLKLCPPANSKKAVKYLDEAKAARKAKRDFEQIRELVMKATEEDTGWAEPWLFLGDLSRIREEYKTMKQAYGRLIEICPDADAMAHYHLGTYYYDTKKYDDAARYLKSFLDFGSDDEKRNSEVALLLFRIKMYKNPVPFNPVPVKGISTPDPEYLAVISPDNENAFFTRRYDETRKGALTSQSVEKFMIAGRDSNGEFELGEPMPLPFNQAGSNNEGGATISKDNRFIYFTKNKNGNFDLYYSEKIKGVWTDIINLGPEINDPKQWDAQPSLSPDGKTLYFASFRDSVYGTSDIFMIKKTDGGFSRPIWLPFNTNGNEKSPFIHPDNITLYFSTDSLPGMGGFDIFMVKRDKNGNWGTPVNLGYPINTEADEVGFFVSTDGERGYYASNKLSGSGGYDVYSFELPESKKPEKVLFVKGQLKNGEEEIPYAAKIELRNISTSEVVNVDYDSLTGNYASVVLFDADYIMTVKKEGYAYNSQYFAEDDTTNKGVVTNDMEMKKIEVGQAYKLNDILFETNSAILSRGSKHIIVDFSTYLKSNPSMRVSIHGHTDAVGDAESNMKLSTERARAVYDFLLTTGISPDRLSYRGFGQTNPVASNDNEEGRSKNRRTEFVITRK